MCGIFCYLFEHGTTNSVEEITSEVERGLRCRGPNNFGKLNLQLTERVSAVLIGCTLHFRGTHMVEQPMVHSDGSFLLWNGEIYDGVQVSDKENDGEVLFQILLQCHDVQTFLSSIAQIFGCWAFVFWQAKKKRLWFGRDVLGRRSLLWQFPQASKGLILSSVAARPHLVDPNKSHEGWHEMPFNGIFSLDVSHNLKASTLYPWSHLATNGNSSIDLSKTSDCAVSYEVDGRCIETPIKHKLCCTIPSDDEVRTLYENAHCRPIKFPFEREEDYKELLSPSLLTNFEAATTQLEKILLKAVERRVLNQPHECERCVKLNRRSGLEKGDVCTHSKVAILFSGGLDSSVLAVLVHKCLPPSEPIDLINVAFSRELTLEEAEDAPDRISGCIAVEELRKIAPNRIWNFVKINVTKEEMKKECEANIADMIYPLCSVLDRDIGCALWFAARGKGTLVDSQPYTTSARILLTGTGADEQLAGYSRHRIGFRRGGWKYLLQELQMEMSRIASRNMGRDDRIISSHGREARFPYLDEELISFLNNLPIHYKTNLQLPQGLGEKFLLRLLAYRLGFRAPAFLAKRAIQFGSKIAKMESGLKGNDICVQLTQK